MQGRQMIEKQLLEMKVFLLQEYVSLSYYGISPL